MKADTAKLRQVLGDLHSADRSFAESLIEASRKWGLTPAQVEWVDKLIARAGGVEEKPLPKTTILVKEIFDMMHLAQRQIKYPKVRIETRGGDRIVFSVAGARARFPGSVNITDGRPYGTNKWYGRILEDGTWQFPRSGADKEIVATVKEFADDPAGRASAYGQRTGNCCFCGRQLTDKRSVTVGYGPVCAERFGLPWGEAEEEPLLCSECGQGTCCREGICYECQCKAHAEGWYDQETGRARVAGDNATPEEAHRTIENTADAMQSRASDDWDH